MLRLKKVNYRARLVKKKSTVIPILDYKIMKISKMLNEPQLSGMYRLDRKSRDEEFAKQLEEWLGGKETP